MRKSEVVLPDTNVVLRYLLNDIPEQYSVAADFFERVRNGSETALILESVLVECVYILLKFYKAPRGEIAESLAGLLLYKGMANPDRDVLVEALRVFAENNLDVVDCVLLVRGKREGAALLTFDKALAKAHTASKSASKD